MNTTHQRTLTITCTEGNEVTKKQHSCFIHNLIADASKSKPLIQWRRSNSKDGIIYCSNGLAEGTLMTLRMLTEKPGVEFTYNRHGKQIYCAVETDGDINCDNLRKRIIDWKSENRTRKKVDSCGQLCFKPCHLVLF